MTVTVVELALIAGAVARLTRLAQTDTILDPARKPLQARASRSGAKAWELLWCPWCLSFWIGIVVVASWVSWGHERWWLAATAVLTASHLTGLSDAFEER